MKKMLIASVALGAAIAGLVLYSRRRPVPGSTKELADASGYGYKKTLGKAGLVERDPIHNMG